jgi:hypothetical protein
MTHDGVRKGQRDGQAFTERYRSLHVFVKWGGRWQVVGDMFFAADPLPLPRTAVKVDPHVYDAYTGQYDLGGDLRSGQDEGANRLS